MYVILSGELDFSHTHLPTLRKTFPHHSDFPLPPNSKRSFPISVLMYIFAGSETKLSKKPFKISKNLD